MKFKKTITSTIVSIMVLCGSIFNSFADGGTVVTLGKDLTDKQKATMLKYFNVNEDEVIMLEVTNQEERKYLEGIATEAQLGKRAYSCSYVEPTKAGSGINVKTVNLTWLSASMISGVLTTADIFDANVVVAAPFKVSGTSALTGIMKAFEDVTNQELSEEKKEIASEELIITGGLSEDVGVDKATGIINDIKTEIIKNNTSDTTQIAQTINNVVNNYNVTISTEQQKQLESLMTRISEQDYDYDKMKKTLKDIKNTVSDNLKEAGEHIDQDFIDSLKNGFNNVKDWVLGLFESKEDLGILEQTKDDLLGENIVVDATNENAINLPTKEEVGGFISKVWNWICSLFEKNEEVKVNEEVETLDFSDEINQEEVPDLVEYKVTID